MKELLRKVDWFQSMGAEALEEIFARGRLLSMVKDGTLFLEGENGSCFYILAEGGVKLYKTGPEGQEVTVRIVQPGEMFAETILYENDRYPVSARALTDSRLFVLERASFSRLLGQESFRRDFISGLMKKMRYLTDRILYLTAFSVEERFFKFLEEQYGRREVYHIPLSKKDFAAAIGTVPETLSRMILKRKVQGDLIWKGKTLTLRKGFWEDGIISEEGP